VSSLFGDFFVYSNRLRGKKKKVLPLSDRETSRPSARRSFLSIKEDLEFKKKINVKVFTNDKNIEGEKLKNIAVLAEQEYLVYV
jgi:hypothetical protein